MTGGEASWWLPDQDRAQQRYGIVCAALMALAANVQFMQTQEVAAPRNNVRRRELYRVKRLLIRRATRTRASPPANRTSERRSTQSGTRRKQLREAV
jgi:hypothetical protein